MQSTSVTRLHRWMSLVLVLVCLCILAAEWFGVLQLIHSSTPLAVLLALFGPAGVWLLIRNVLRAGWRTDGVRLRADPRTVAFFVGTLYGAIALVSPPVQGAREGSVVAIVAMTSLVAAATARDGFTGKSNL
jgi:hypothetical protein